VNGDTALTLVRCLLERGRYAAALTLAQRLVAAGADVNHRYTDKGILNHSSKLIDYKEFYYNRWHFLVFSCEPMMCFLVNHGIFLL
jgi:hypothetical protein